MIKTLTKRVSKGFATASIIVGASMGAFVGSASAALPASAGTALTDIQTDGLALADLAWPVLAAIVGAGIIMKLFKRFVNKAT